MCSLIVRSCALLVGGVFSAFATQSVVIKWSPSPSPNVIGYNVYYGVTNGVYTNEFLVGSVTNLVISGLVNGSTYYFAATAINSFGLPSSFSSQTSYTIPLTVAAGTLGALEHSSNVVFTITGTPGYSYAIQASSNLLDWTFVETNISPWTFTDTNAKFFHQRFYRSVYPP